MPDAIPKFAIAEVLKGHSSQALLSEDYHLTVSPPGHKLTNIPYRTTFYAVGLCRAGTVELKVNRDYYHVAPGSLMLLGPEALRHWQQQSADYYTEALFFTETFFSAPYTDPTRLRQFAFFSAQATRVLSLSAAEVAQVGQLLEQVRQTLKRPSQHQADIVRSYVTILLLVAADSYEQRMTLAEAPPRQIDLVTRFQLLVAQPDPHCRRVADYASLLCVTSKYLSETLKATTGKTAGEWIDSQVLREARHLLWQTDRSIMQVAEELGFSDASAFGKFFRRQTGQTPLAYKQQRPL
ncbi:helix-turn-helix domain-containing protein [Dyadobacter chenwenxiniae]|uniref:Helix-turn-helix domain-containing protein n=1 Tax=Dyadobacter chenwenxiniae TaxID=2906456 RepID=A0A9X1TDI7_9BACT|nr:helix-turn-helix domain-containing protein [Dyadobacter chenwenxiniae]MCF0060400.1 helix-turn-helix domain-containing protein [Dyadobacter chenwenxiniae]UON86131.1 helix-turn-helix domain-containing protein [Dyadobacter chenwenxiniae]